MLIPLEVVVMVIPKYLADGTESRTVPFRVYWWCSLFLFLVTDIEWHFLALRSI